MYGPDEFHPYYGLVMENKDAIRAQMEFNGAISVYDDDVEHFCKV